MHPSIDWSSFDTWLDIIIKTLPIIIATLTGIASVAKRIKSRADSIENQIRSNKEAADARQDDIKVELNNMQNKVDERHEANTRTLGNIEKSTSGLDERLRHIETTLPTVRVDQLESKVNTNSVAVSDLVVRMKTSEVSNDLFSRDVLRRMERVEVKIDRLVDRGTDRGADWGGSGGGSITARSASAPLPD